MTSRLYKRSVRDAVAGMSLLFASAANADVSISSKPTQNMDCESGVCTATGAKAVLNADDLQTMLAGGDVAVQTGSLAKDIDIDQPLTWATTSRLTLDARQSVTIKKQVTISGTGNLSIVTNDGGGKKGEFVIVPEHGSVQFWDLASSLIINGNSYTLVGDIKTLAADIAANPSGLYALAKPYDASGDGTYTTSVVPTTLLGIFDGLGNAISNLTLSFSPSQSASLVGLFSFIDKGGIVRNARVVDASASGYATCDRGAGVSLLIAAIQQGSVENSVATGSISILGRCDGSAGALVAINIGSVSNSYSNVKISIVNVGNGYAGGLVGFNGGTVSDSYSRGSIEAKGYLLAFVGGLVGDNEGAIANSFTLSAVREGKDCCGSPPSIGGLVGQNAVTGTIVSSYTAGKINWMHSADPNALRGGLIGIDNSSAGSLMSTYWNLDRGIGDPSQGAGNTKNDPGITGLTDAQLKSALPNGFDPKIWGSDPNINNGYPYLLANPPQ